ncbi:MAG TPA: histidine kinase [Gaiellaceae bacterium]
MQVVVPIALLVGLLRERLARAGVADLVRELERTSTTGVRDAIARALDDESLEVGLWVPEQQVYVDADGNPFPLPGNDPRRTVTELVHDGRRIAVLVHDSALAEEPRLVEGVAAAAALALENVRLQAELRAPLVDVRESRARIASAADAERRRIERNLHDGAQQRLVALALNLLVEQRKLAARGTPELESVVSGAVRELQAAVDELRELSHGVHPTILAQAGLGPALASLAERAPMRVELGAVPAERLAPEIEATAYYVASRLTSIGSSRSSGWSRRRGTIGACSLCSPYLGRSAAGEATITPGRTVSNPNLA